MRKLVTIEIHASGRRCANDCPHLRTFVDGSRTCALFDVALSRDAKARPLRAKPCRESEIGNYPG